MATRSIINDDIWNIIETTPNIDEGMKELIKKILMLELENEDRSSFDAITPIKIFLEDSEL